MAVPEIDIDELVARREEGALVVDVREPGEYHEFHVPGAKLLPLATVPESVDEFPTDEPVYVICRTGRRSASAAEFLRKHDVDAINVAGGTVAWVAAGHRVVRDSSEIDPDDPDEAADGPNSGRGAGGAATDTDQSGLQ